MSEFDLLSAVQPQDGWFAVLGIKNKITTQKMVRTREDADKLIAKFLENQQDVYFGVAKFKDGTSRKKDNVQSVQSLWADIDCGPGKPYADQAEGAAALKGCVEALGLPRPVMVNSGRGIHAYWPLTDAVSRSEWEPVSTALRDAAKAHGLDVDPTCFEVARILRVPGTYNYKGDEPLPVEVLSGKHKPMPLAEFATLLGAKPPVAETTGSIPSGGRRVSPLMQQVIDSSDTSFRKILARGVNGCRQLVSCVEESATLPEPLWRAALSVAAKCHDREKAYTALSQGHPDYDPDETRRKAENTAGPHSCKQFDTQNPGGCDGCPHKGKLTSPVQLGREVIEGPPITEEDEETGEVVQYTLPHGFLRGLKGGIWRKARGEEDEDTLVYEQDLYVVSRTQSARLGDSALVRVHTQMDGVRDFDLSLADLSKINEMKTVLATNGIIVSDKEYVALQGYLQQSVRGLARRRKAEVMRHQFGWIEKRSAFVLGEREIYVGGVRPGAVAPEIRHLADNYTPHGSFEKWREVFDIYGMAGMEPFAFGAGVTFGSPLLHMTGQSGALLNLVSGDSGTGKTTALHMCNSVWGDPHKLCAKKEDTLLAKLHKLGMHNNLPICFDEMTNTEARDLSELVYNVTHGVGRDRMSSSANSLRANNTMWNTIALCSSNRSFYDVLEGLKGKTQGEMMRIIEYSVEFPNVLDPLEGQRLFDRQLRENFGHAGPIYVAHLIRNYERVKHDLLDTQRRFEAEIGLHQNERFWSSTASAVITGIHHAKEAGLHNWNVGKMFRWGCGMIDSLRGSTTPPPDADIQFLNNFILANTHHMIVVDEIVDMRSKEARAAKITGMTPLPTHAPTHRDIRLRYERGADTLYITVAAFKAACDRVQVNHGELRKKLIARGVLQPEAKPVRMAHGAGYYDVAVRALAFDTSHSAFAIMEEAVERAKSDEAIEDESVGS